MGEKVYAAVGLQQMVVSESLRTSCVTGLTIGTGLNTHEDNSPGFGPQPHLGVRSSVGITVGGGSGKTVGLHNTAALTFS